MGDRNVGFVFQNYAIFTHMSVYENLAFGLKSQPRKTRMDKGEIDRAGEGRGRDRRPVRRARPRPPRGSRSTTSRRSRSGAR